MGRQHCCCVKSNWSGLATGANSRAGRICIQLYAVAVFATSSRPRASISWVVLSVDFFSIADCNDVYA